MDILHNLAIGFGAAATPINLLFCLFGCLIGTLIGVLPGIGPIATIAMLLPVTFGLSPLGALIMLAGIYYGAQYGGSTTAILVNLPGELSSVVTCIDGYRMAQRGRAGAALAIAAIGSFFAGTVGTILIAAFAPILAKFAEQFRSPEYFSLMLFGLVAAVVLAHGSIVKAVAMIILGLLIGLAGTDTQSGVARFTFGVPELYDGVDFVPVAMGLFGFAEIMSNLDRRGDQPTTTAPISSLWPNREEIRRAIPAILRGTSIGSFLGILPGGGAVLASFAAYTLEKKVSRYASEFGKGAVEGVAGPESANNAGAQTFVHSAAHAGHSINPGDGADDGRHDDLGDRARHRHHHRASAVVLGHDRLDVDRQPDAGHHQPAADRHLGDPAQGALSDPVSIHTRVLLRGRVQHQQQHVPDHDDGRIRVARLRVSQARLREARRSCSALCWDRSWRKICAARWCCRSAIHRFS